MSQYAIAVTSLVFGAAMAVSNTFFFFWSMSRPSNTMAFLFVFAIFTQFIVAAVGFASSVRAFGEPGPRVAIVCLLSSILALGTIGLGGWGALLLAHA